MSSKTSEISLKEKSYSRSLDVISSHSLSSLVSQVNSYNSREGVSPIRKEDIVSILKEEGIYLLLYYRDNL